MSRTDSLVAVEREIGVLIRRVRRVIGARAAMVHPDLQPAAYLMIAFVAEQGPQRSSTIAERFEIDKGAISRQVQHGVELGLIERAPDPADGRASIIDITAEGRRRFEEVVVVRRRILDERLGDWDDAELALFADQMVRYNASLEVGELVGSAQPDRGVRG